MKIIGFNFKKISAERINESGEKLKINTGINISEISSVKSDLFRSKEEIVQIVFNYTINYEPEYAKVDFSGVLLLSLEPKDARKIVSEWKEKKIPEEFKIIIFNAILRKSSIKALELEEELHLPLHISLPKVSSEKKE
jgi:hypothetical protein